MGKSKGKVVISDLNAYQTYIDALQNPYTRKNYEIHFNSFKNTLKASDTCNELLTWEPRDMEDRIVKYVKQMDSRGASSSSINLTLTAIKKFYVENRCENRINWKWLKGRVPQNRGKVKDRDYTKQELQTILKHCDTRKKAILLLLMTGIRKGAIPFIRVGNLKKITEYFDAKGEKKTLDNHVYKLTVYENESEEYYTFMSNESAKAIDTYLALRRQAGEVITDNSPLIRDAFNPFNVKEPKPVTTTSLDMMFTRMLRASGLRISNGKENRQDRHEVMLFHGIRKYVNHCYVNARVDNIKKELLQGHTIRLEGSYLKPTENEMLLEWLKAVDCLSLSDEEILRSENIRLSAENEDIGAARRGYADMSVKVEDLTAKNKDLRDRLKRLEDQNREYSEEEDEKDQKKLEEVAFDKFWNENRELPQEQLLRKFYSMMQKKGKYP